MSSRDTLGVDKETLLKQAKYAMQQWYYEDNKCAGWDVKEVAYWRDCFSKLADELSVYGLTYDDVEQWVWNNISEMIKRGAE